LSVRGRTRRRAHGQPSSTTSRWRLAERFPLASSGRHRSRRALAPFAFLGGALGVGLVAGLLVAPAALATGAGAARSTDLWQAMDVDVPFDASLPKRSVMVDRNGEVFATLFEENRIPITREQIAPVFVDALLATEDTRFYEHGGVDLMGTGRAILNNALGGNRQGASTLTQQWIKNLVQTAADTDEKKAAAAEVSVGRKLAEARAAAEAEQRFSKDEILTNYVNTAFYGNGAYGLGAAAARYYSTTSDQLSLNQAAVLAGVLNSPTLFDPINNPDEATSRRNVVLDRMVTEGKIDTAEAEATKALPLELVPSIPASGCAGSAYPVYCEWVKSEILNDPSFASTPEARQELLYRGGLRIETPLDPQVQTAAQTAVLTALEPTNRVAAAVAVVQPGSGQVLALVSNRPWGPDESIGQTEVPYPILPNFPPGSTFKPITLAAALENGFDPGTVWYAPARYIPANLNYPDGGFGNADDGPGGTMNAEVATWRSVNTYYVWLVEQVGVLDTARMAQKLGMSSIRTEGVGAVGERDASLTLGDFNTSPLQIASVYATFAAGGVRCQPIAVTSLLRDGTESLPVASADCQQAIDPRIAAQINTILQGNVDGPDPLRTAQGASIGRPVIGKTGTAGDFASAWFAGATPQMAAGVWVGDPRGGVANPLTNVSAYGGTQFFSQVFGGQIPASIFKDFMSSSHEGRPPVAFPPATQISLPTVSVPNVVGMPLDAALGALTDVGLTVQIAPETAASPQALPPNYVIASDPPAGTPRDSGRPVVLTLSEGSSTEIQPEQ
jgi:membrane peptidoglycan carboxypeptidase